MDLKKKKKKQAVLHPECTMSLLGSGRDTLTCVCRGQWKPLNLPHQFLQIAWWPKPLWAIAWECTRGLFKVSFIVLSVSLTEGEQQGKEDTIPPFTSKTMSTWRLNPITKAWGSDVQYSTKQFLLTDCYALCKLPKQRQHSNKPCPESSSAFLKFCEGHQRLNESSDLLTLFFNDC